MLICDRDEEVEVYALNKRGLIAEGYEGLKSVSFDIEESGGKVANSYSELPKELSFKGGRASILFSNSEAEIIKIKIREGEYTNPFPAQIMFKFPEHPVRFSIDLNKRGSLDKPVNGVVMALDKNDYVATEYDGIKVPIMIEESGAKDSSYIIKPSRLEFKNGKAKFSIQGSEDKESLTVNVIDPQKKIQTATAEIDIGVADTSPPEVLELKMETLAFVELTFSEELEVASATDLYHYEVVCFDTQRPLNVELQTNKVILELEDLLRPYDEMYVVFEDIKDLSGNVIERGTRSPTYSVPKIRIRLELEASSTQASTSSAIDINLTARCISGRVPKFVNGQFEVEVEEELADGSFTLSSRDIQMTGGKGAFSVSNTQPETLTVTVKDPEGYVDSASVELVFN